MDATKKSQVGKNCKLASGVRDVRKFNDDVANSSNRTNPGDKRICWAGGNETTADNRPREPFVIAIRVSVGQLHTYRNALNRNLVIFLAPRLDVRLKRIGSAGMIRQDSIRARWQPFTKALVFTTVLVLAAFGTHTAQAQTYKVIYSFTGFDGTTGGSYLVRDAAGNFYGSSPQGGNLSNCSGGCGDVYKLSPTGKLTYLYTFQGAPDGAYPVGALLDVKGNLFGATQAGGTGTAESCGSNGSGGCGTIFKVTANGNETVLYSFAGPPNDGMAPNAGLVRDAKGNFYGTTLFGDSYSTYGNPGEGTVFKVNGAGKEALLYEFTGGNDGGMPFASLLLRDGVLYGTTSRGGTGPCGDDFGPGCGTVFKVEGGKETVVYSFQNKSDGGYPVSSLISDKAGNLYGTTAVGGDLKCTQPSARLPIAPSSKPPIQPPPKGCGTVFKITLEGKETVLHAFKGTTDGSQPQSSLVMDSAGNLFGTTPFGGDLSCGDSGEGCGVVFEIDTAGHFKVLHTFTAIPGGEYPQHLTLDDKGNIYGLAAEGNAGAGVIFKLTP